MVSSTDIFAYGASIWHTTDGGTTWSRLSYAPAVDTMASGESGVWVGLSCPDQSSCPAPINVVSNGHFVPLSHQPAGVVEAITTSGAEAYAIVDDGDGDTELAVSGDGGTTWQQRAFPQTDCSSMRPGFTVTTTGAAYLVCASGASAGTEPKDLFASEDAGVTWSARSTLEASGYADGIVAASPDVLWRYGARAPVFRSTDAGRSWQDQLDDKVGDAAGASTEAFAASGTVALTFAFALPPSSTFTGPSTINEYRTTDTGATWQTIPLQP